MPKTIVVLFTRDLRVHDHPALAAAAADAELVVPLFVLDSTILSSAHVSPNRVCFLVDSLRDLRRSLRSRGATLVIRAGDPVEEAIRVADATAASAVYVSADVTAYATRRERRLAAACQFTGRQLVCFPGVTVIPPADLRTHAGGHYRVFTPYWRAWRSRPWRSMAAAPLPLRLPPSLHRVGTIPAATQLVAGPRSARLRRGGEGEGRARMENWLRSGIERYEQTHDDLAGTGTSHLGADLHFGCISPLELAVRSAASEAGEAFLRQLCWRDFHHQVTQAFPAISSRDYRPRDHRWRHRPDLLELWKLGRTGVPIVDAAMRQLRAEGWMPNRARLITATFLVKTLGIDWREGASHFLDWLCDGDIANNSGNWQWVAGTGNDTRPNRRFNLMRQARRFDPEGAYVRRHVPELRAIAGGAVHDLGVNPVSLIGPE